MDGMRGDGNHDDDDDDDDDDDHDGRWAAFLDESDVGLPPGVDPLDIAQILISDLDGNILLVGDLVDPAPTFHDPVYSEGVCRPRLQQLFDLLFQEQQQGAGEDHDETG